MRISYWLSGTSPLQGDLSRGGARSRTAPPPPRSPCCCFRACPPAMASIKDLEGRWRLTESQGFEEYMKELDHLHLHRRCPGPAPELGRKGKHNNQKSEGWKAGGGLCHEQCHLYSGL
ncbi:fatty acid-binding protein 5 isoform X2 [Microtus pennsylvanicus]|uniref:fatty acid-binding protein 5 isoform X2 n=1 Tax=Microtus pennsylvanicus TaxID=10058 RepID=UPI003F6C8630